MLRRREKNKAFSNRRGFNPDRLGQCTDYVYTVYRSLMRKGRIRTSTELISFLKRYTFLKPIGFKYKWERLTP